MTGSTTSTATRHRTGERGMVAVQLRLRQGTGLVRGAWWQEGVAWWQEYRICDWQYNFDCDTLVGWGGSEFSQRLPLYVSYEATNHRI